MGPGERRPHGGPQVLERHFETNPRARKFRDRPIPNTNKLQTLCDGALVTGEHASTGSSSVSSHPDSQLLLEDETVNNNDEIDRSSDTTDEWPPSPPHPATGISTSSVLQMTTSQGGRDPDGDLTMIHVVLRRPNLLP
jgi:hypothetical protein